METFKKEYTDLAEAIITYAIVMPALKVEDREPDKKTTFQFRTPSLGGVKLSEV